MMLAINKIDGHSHINTARRERLPKKTNLTRYYVATKGLPKRWSISFIKVSGRMHNDAFKKASLQFYSNSFGLKQLSTTIKSFHYYSTGVSVKPF